VEIEKLSCDVYIVPSLYLCLFAVIKLLEYKGSARFLGAREKTISHPETVLRKSWIRYYDSAKGRASFVAYSYKKYCARVGVNRVLYLFDLSIYWEVGLITWSSIQHDICFVDFILIESECSR